MNYELAKELKDAGFPQKEHHNEFGMGSDFRGDVIGCDPSLEEIIEACYAMDVQIVLESRLPISSTKDRPRWYAKSIWWEDHGIKWASEGGTNTTNIIGEEYTTEGGIEY